MKRVPWGWAFHLLAVVAAGAALRAAHLPGASLWWDEFITLGKAMLPLPEMARDIAGFRPSDVGFEFFPPLFHVIIHAALHNGANDVTARIPSLIAGVLTLPAFYLAGAVLFNRRVGLLAALLLALCVYHIHYSREVRPYALFHLLNVCSLVFVYLGCRDNRPVHWAGYALSGAAMLYTSYLASVSLAAYGAFAALVAFKGERLGPEFRSGRAVLRGYLLASAAALAVYLPWLDEHWFVLSQLRLAGEHHPLRWVFIRSSLEEFTSFAAYPASRIWMAYAALSLAGLASCLRGGKAGAGALAALWAFAPLAALPVARTPMEPSSRYVFTVLFFLLLMSAVAVDLLCSWGLALVWRNGGGRRAARAVRLALGLGASLLLGTTGIGSLENYYKRETSYFRPLMDFLASNRNNIDTLLSYSNRQQKVVAQWYLPGEFKTLRDYSGGAYRRCFLLAPGVVNAANRPAGTSFRISLGDDSVLACGLANRSPLLLAPGPDGGWAYAEDFSTLSLYSDCSSATNTAPDLMQGALTLYDPREPGELVYKLRTLPGAQLESLSLELAVRLSVNPHHRTDSRLSVAVSQNGKEYREATVVAWEDFGTPGAALERIGPNTAVLRRVLDLKELVGDARQFHLKFSLTPSESSGQLLLDSFLLGSGFASTGEGVAAREYFANVARNTPVTPWRPDVYQLEPATLHAFSRDDSRLGTGSWNPQEDLEAFRRAHPLSEPVLTQAFPDGTPALEFHDPALADPFLRILPGEEKRIMTLDCPASFVALKLEGEVRGPVFTVDGQQQAIPVHAPGTASVTLNAGGRGRVAVSPLFSGSGFAMEASASGGELVRPKNEDCLTCRGPQPCWVEYTLRSEYPVDALRIEWYPRTFGDAAGKNVVRALCSFDGGPFIPMDTLPSRGSLLWEGLKVLRISSKTPEKPARSVTVRFELSGDGAQLWSTGTTRMLLEAGVDSRAFSALRSRCGAAAMRLEENSGAGLGVLPLAQPVRFFDALRRAY